MFIQHNDISSEDGLIVCSIPNSKFSDFRFTIGKVSFKEQNDKLKVVFNYKIVNKKILWPWNKKRFIKEVGDHLIEEVNYRLNNGELIFSGGEGLSTYE